MNEKKLVKYSINNGKNWDEWMMDESLTESEIIQEIADHYEIDENNIKIEIV